MPSSSSASSPLTQILVWCLSPWFFPPHPDEDLLLGVDLQIPEPNSPPAQMVGMPVQTLPSEIHTHIGQFLTDAQYANLVNQHIFTQAQHDIAINELSNQQLDYLLSRHVFTDEQLAYQLNHNLLTINQINMISTARLVNLIQKALLLNLDFMSNADTARFISILSNKELSSLIINDALTLRQLKRIDRLRLGQISPQAVIHIINMETDDKDFIGLLITSNVQVRYSPWETRTIQISTAILLRMVETTKWDYYLHSTPIILGNLINSYTLNALDSRGNYLLTAVYLNKPQTQEDLQRWRNFMWALGETISNDGGNTLNFVSLEAFTQWVNMIVNTRGHHPLFNTNVLSDERFTLINMSYFLYEIPIVGNFQLKSRQTIKTIYGFMALVNGAHDFSSYLIDGSSIDYLFDTMARLSRGRRDVLREVYKQLDLDKKVLFVASTGYNPLTDDGLSLDSGGAGSSNDPPRPPGSSNDPPLPPGSSNDPHGGETRRLEQATTLLTPGLNYFGKELSLQPSEVKASVTTKANLLPYDIVHNRLPNGNDHHWYRITLSKGSIYNFNMVKEGDSNLDANLVLRDTTGAVVATDTGLGGGHTQYLSVSGGRNALISFIAPYSGDYYLDASSAAVYVADSPNDMGNPSVGDFHGTGGYRLSSALIQKMALDVGAQAVDLIEVNTDRDWYQIHLNRGERYNFKLEHNSEDGLQPLLCLRDAQGNAMLTSDSNDDFQCAPFASIDFTAVQSGDYFLDVGSSHAASTGQYRLSISRDDVLAVTSTSAKIVVGETNLGTLENNQDHDWYKVELKAGITYQFFLKHVNNTDHLDPWLNLRDISGKIIKSDDDSAGDLNSLIQFKATQNTTYFLDAGSYHDQSRGQFSLSSVSVL